MPWGFGGGCRTSPWDECEPSVQLAPDRARDVLGLSGTTASAERAQSDAIAAASDNGFIPIGVFACAPDGGPALIAGPAVATPPLPPRPAAQVRAEVDKRVGLIEIDLADGTRLRVDTFVNERALQRVLTVLKARS